MVLLIYICLSHTIVQQRVSTHVFADVELGLLVMINSSTFFATKLWAIQTSVLIGLKDVQPLFLWSSLLVCTHLCTQISMMIYTHAPTWKQSLIRGYTTGLQVIKCWDGEAMIDPAVLDIENSDITWHCHPPLLAFFVSLSIFKFLTPMTTHIPLILFARVSMSGEIWSSFYRGAAARTTCHFPCCMHTSIFWWWRISPDDDSYTADFICESFHERRNMVFFLPRGLLQELRVIMNVECTHFFSCRGLDRCRRRSRKESVSILKFCTNIRMDVKFSCNAGVFSRRPCPRSPLLVSRSVIRSVCICTLTPLLVQFILRQCIMRMHSLVHGNCLNALWFNSLWMLM